MEDHRIEALMNQMETLHRNFSASMKRLKNYLGIDEGQMGILKYLSTHPEGVKAGELAEVLGVGYGRIGNILKIMEKRRQITRQRDSSDNRCVIVKLTSEGREEFKRRKSEFIDNATYIVDQVGQKNIQAMMETLTTIARYQDRYTQSITKKGEKDAETI
ncbi:MAG TPA: hypothetical protein DEA32_00090 [Firmicutes bacterium]|nr:hypothetical protein [Bacillota bacterium]